MTELNETIEEADPDAENVSPEDNAITATESDSNSEEESTDENPFFAKNWMLIAKPKKLQFESQNLKSDYAKFSLDSVEPGCGTTIGHSLRRVLLSSIR